MRKFHKAAVVATMVGSVSMVGAGAAAAGDFGHPAPKALIVCSQNVGDNTGDTDVDSDIETDEILAGGNAQSLANQPICGIGNTGGTVTSDDATGGDASILD